MTNNSVLKKIGVLFIFLIGIIIGAGGLWLAIENNTELRYFLLDQATADLPQVKIAAFVQSIVHDDKTTALKLWELGGASSEQQSALGKRREGVISDLLASKINPEYTVLGIEWWTTCCDPNVTNSSRDAGGARINVQFLDKNGDPISYIFDVFTREQPYWGGAEGYQPRDWVIRDVYPYDQSPMYWLLIYEPQIRYIQPSKP